MSTLTLPPWVATDLRGNNRYTVLRRGPSTRAPDIDFGEGSEADVALCAAAHDLLAACKLALNSGAIKFADNALDRHIRGTLNAAIEKAEHHE